MSFPDITKFETFLKFGAASKVLLEAVKYEKEINEHQHYLLKKLEKCITHNESQKKLLKIQEKILKTQNETRQYHNWITEAIKKNNRGSNYNNNNNIDTNSSISSSSSLSFQNQAKVGNNFVYSSSSTEDDEKPSMVCAAKKRRQSPPPKPVPVFNPNDDNNATQISAISAYVHVEKKNVFNYNNYSYNNYKQEGIHKRTNLKNNNNCSILNQSYNCKNRRKRKKPNKSLYPATPSDSDDHDDDDKKSSTDILSISSSSPPPQPPPIPLSQNTSGFQPGANVTKEHKSIRFIGMEIASALIQQYPLPVSPIDLYNNLHNKFGYSIISLNELKNGFNNNNSDYIHYDSVQNMYYVYPNLFEKRVYFTQRKMIIKNKWNWLNKLFDNKIEKEISNINKFFSIHIGWKASNNDREQLLNLFHQAKNTQNTSSHSHKPITYILSYSEMLICVMSCADYNGFKEDEFKKEFKYWFNINLDLHNHFIIDILDSIRDPNCYKIRKRLKLGIKSKHQYNKIITWWKDNYMNQSSAVRNNHNINNNNNNQLLQPGSYNYHY